MTEFVSSPLFDNWFKKFKPEKSLIICSPYIKQKAVDEIFAFYNVSDMVEKLDIKILIRGTAEEFLQKKSSDFSVLDSLLEIKSFDISKIKRIENLHMKAYLVDDKYLLITSGNFTNSGMFVLNRTENFEGGISTNESSVIESFKKYFYDIWDQGEFLEDFYDELLKEYNNYLKTEYSDKKAFDRIKRKKYVFQSTTSLSKNNDKKKESKVKNIEKKYVVSDFPTPSNFSYLLDTLLVLSENPDGLSQKELGKLLRIMHGYDDQNNDVSNQKYGEEKGKYARYFGLVSVIKGSRNTNIFKISKLGIAYLGFDNAQRINCLKDTFFSKPAIDEIIEAASKGKINLSFFVKNCCDAQQSTINRIVPPTRALFKEIASTCEDNDISEALGNIE